MVPSQPFSALEQATVSVWPLWIAAVGWNARTLVAQSPHTPAAHWASVHSSVRSALAEADVGQGAASQALALSWWPSLQLPQWLSLVRRNAAVSCPFAQEPP
jgi:hypothetical protein